MFLGSILSILFSFCAQTNITPATTDNRSGFNLFKYKLDLNETRNIGLDERLSKMSGIIDGADLDYDLLSRINENFYKKNVLSVLTNSKISELEKMNTLNRYLLYVHDGPPVNLLAGGLLDDWEFDIN